MPNYFPINANEDNKFFVALCTRYNLPPVRHSFVCFGVETPDGKKTILGAFGKVIDHNFSELEFATTGVSSGKIVNEHIFFTEDNNGSNSLFITYKAYAISYENYCKFLGHLKRISKKQGLMPLEAYSPVENDRARFHWLPLHSTKGIDKNQEKTNISFETSNNCRHTAIRFTKKVTGLSKLGYGVSSFFRKNLPLSTRIHGFSFGEQGEHIFILPLPPSSFGIGGIQQKILKKLYLRMDNMLKIKPNDPLTIDKFEKLKSLYESKTKNYEGNLEPLFEEIETWVRQNQACISSHRESHWFYFPTSTECLFEEIKNLRPSI